ncbi:MAG: HEAT repeat domain-containing protein, partial [Methylibium sp.]|uniref:HEAT repeat domain-containing protein n=1 Tax=Methylibium sp. TaxID=2067992 RepID=UPI0017E73045
TDGLVAQLGDADASVRRWAARDLADHPRAAAALCAHLADEPDASVRAVLFSSAARLGGSAVVDAMLPLLRSEDAGLRNGAIEVLAGLPEAVTPHVERLLQDEDSDVRIFTVNLLGDLRHPMVPQWLANVLLHESAVNVVGAALEVLAEVGTPASLPALRAAAQRFADDPYINFSVDLAIVRSVTP